MSPVKKLQKLFWESVLSRAMRMRPRIVGVINSRRVTFGVWRGGWQRLQAPEFSAQETTSLHRSFMETWDSSREEWFLNKKHSRIDDDVAEALYSAIRRVAQFYAKSQITPLQKQLTTERTPDPGYTPLEEIDYGWARSGSFFPLAEHLFR